MMKILHLPGRAIWGYSEDEIKDILTYFKPDIILTSKIRKKEKKVVEKNFSFESITMEDVQKFKKRRLGNEVVLILRNEGSLSDIDLAELKNKKVVLITDLIKEHIDPKSFNYDLVNTSILDEFQSELGDFHALSTEIETGKKPMYGKKRIYGLGLSNGMEDIKIPSVITRENLKIETLDATKVGISAVPGLGKRFSAELEQMDIKSRKDLCSIKPENILGCEGIGPYRSTKWISSAKAIEEEEVYRIDENDLEGKHRIFIDIETDSLNPSIIWHIGLYDDSTGEYRSFLEKDPSEKGRVVKQFLDYLQQNAEDDSVLLAWYGKKFDFEHLGRFAKKYVPGKEHIFEEIEKIDFMYWVDKHAALPCRCSKLESVASRLGYDPELIGLDGKEVGRIYSEYMKDGKKEPDWQALKTYAKDDVIAMKHIYDKIERAPLLYHIEEVKKKYVR